MNQRDADTTILVGHTGHTPALPGSATEPPTRTRSQEEEAVREEGLDYVPVPPRNSQTVLVRFRPGDRLQPLLYSLDDEDT